MIYFFIYYFFLFSFIKMIGGSRRNYDSIVVKYGRCRRSIKRLWNVRMVIRLRGFQHLDWMPPLRAPFDFSNLESKMKYRREISSGLDEILVTKDLVQGRFEFLIGSPQLINHSFRPLEVLLASILERNCRLIVTQFETAPVSTYISPSFGSASLQIS